MFILGLNKKKDNFNSIVDSSISQLSNIIDVDTVMGKPIILEDGDCIIPFSSVIFGVLLGGGEYGKVNIFSKNNELPHSAGSGSIVSIKPSGFLVKSNKDNTFKIISANQTDYEKILEKFRDVLVSNGNI